MAAAPVIGIVAGAASTAAQISGQRAQANAQRKQIEAQKLAARDNYRLTKQRFDYARSSSAQMYLRERQILDAKSEQSRQQLTLQRLDQEQQNIAAENQQMQQNAQVESAISNLLSQASQVRGSAALEEMGVSNALTDVAQQNQSSTLSQLQAMAGRGIDPVSALSEQIGQVSLLDTIAQFQNAVEARNTIDRVAGYQAGALEKNASLTRNYGNILSDFNEAQNAIQAEYQGIANRLAPSILSLQNQRNAVGLEAARYSREAEMTLGQQSAAVQYLNQNRIANAQLSGIRGPSFLGAVGSLAGNIAGPVGTLVAQNSAASSAPGSRFNWSTNSYTDGSSSGSFNNRVAPYQVPSSGLEFPVMLDVPRNIPTYG